MVVGCLLLGASRFFRLREEPGQQNLGDVLFILATLGLAAFYLYLFFREQKQRLS